MYKCRPDIDIGVAMWTAMVVAIFFFIALNERGVCAITHATIGVRQVVCAGFNMGVNSGSVGVGVRVMKADTHSGKKIH